MIYPVAPHGFEFELNKDLHFSAAHFIDDARAGKCRNVHGHNYIANITIVGDRLDDMGFLVNFSELKKVVTEAFDHTILNDHPRFQNVPPTTETVARTIHEMISEFLKDQSNTVYCLQIFLRETPTSYAVYRPKEFK